MTESILQPAIAALVLAAGRSSRFGTSKLTAKLHGKVLVQHALLAAQEACPGNVHLVVGHDRDNIETAAGDLFDRVIFSDNYADGLGASIAAGVSACGGDFEAILVVLADQALIKGTHLRAIVQCWRDSSVDIVISSFDETVGPPILFAKPVFSALSQLQGDSGARCIVDSGEFSVAKVRCQAASVDIDTPEDLDAIAQR